MIAMLRTVICIVAACSACLAQESRIIRPTLGYVHDARHRVVRPIWGTPGAATMGEPLQGFGEITSATIAHQRGYALAAIAEQAEMRLITLDEPTAVQTLAIPSAIAVIALSPDQRTAALVARDDRRLYVLTGLPQAPEIMWTSESPSAVQNLAIADDGETLLASGAGSVFQVTRAGVSTIRQMDPVPALAFLPGSRDAVAAGEQLWMVRSGGTEWSPIAVDSTIQASRLGVTPNGREIVVAGRSEITVIALEDQAVRRVQCECAPEALELHQPGSLFRLTRLDSGPLWFIDATGKEPRLWFVPVQRNE